MQRKHLTGGLNYKMLDLGGFKSSTAKGQKGKVLPAPTPRNPAAKPSTPVGHVYQLAMRRFLKFFFVQKVKGQGKAMGGAVTYL